MIRLNTHSHNPEEAAEADVIAQFKQAVNENDVESASRLLHRHPTLAARINEPWFAFDSPAIVNAAGRGNRRMVDLLLEYGADINAKSSWWAGGFGVLHHGHKDLSRYLIERGARIDPHAAAALGMLDNLRQMTVEDPNVVNERGPDGQVPLHYAESTGIIDYLLDNGADIDMRDIDHNSTPAQYAVKHPDKCRHLLARGARTDIFMACQLGDAGLARSVLKDDPHALQAVVGEGDYTSGDSNGGHIYEYLIGKGTRPLFLAERLGHEELTALLLSHSTMEQRFLLACYRADADTVTCLLSEHPDIVQSLQPDEQSLITDAAWEHRTDAVRLMLEVGFDVDASSSHAMTALHRAAIRGDRDIIRLLLTYGASIHHPNEFGADPLNSCIWGSMHIRDPQGDYAAAAEALIEAGSRLPAQAYGSAAVKAVLMRRGVSS